MAKCKICGEEKPHDRGMMYCGICSGCCIKNGLCEDCGQPIASLVGACTGLHGLWRGGVFKGRETILTPYMKMQEEHAQVEYRKYQEALKLVRDFLEELEAPEDVKSALIKVSHPPRSEWI